MLTITVTVAVADLVVKAACEWRTGTEWTMCVRHAAVIVATENRHDTACAVGD